MICHNMQLGISFIIFYDLTIVGKVNKVVIFIPYHIKERISLITNKRYGAEWTILRTHIMRYFRI